MAGDRLRIICGPTAAGKSDLALKLCETYHAAIVSADSRQIYCEFNIGTAKPTREECARVTHYGVDVVEPDERYSAARWASEADEWIESAGGIEKDAVVIVGGTGLYIKALVDPLFDAPDQDPIQRGQLERELATMSVDDLRRWCKQLDPARAHLGRTQLLRAIETALLSGSRISDLHSRHKAAKETEALGQTAAYLVVDPGDVLGSRIEARVDKMLDAGWADEVRELMRTVSPDAQAWKASGYMVMRSHVEGALDLSSATQRVIIETRQYAKRQRTWFRNQLPAAAVTHVNPDDPHALTIAREWWERAE
ncbi:MAG TPA: tRNA (adenosine(37)-N6)-dimethylallyltransferase MiaA [Gemmatimonadaceae bacterium]|nr:tRNA (adenosine(37)-N6)-dimethylallyltransferase MiaA [Gemmatimonadaceae bacterium]